MPVFSVHTILRALFGNEYQQYFGGLDQAPEGLVHHDSPGSSTFLMPDNYQGDTLGLYRLFGYRGTTILGNHPFLTAPVPQGDSFAEDPLSIEFYPSARMLDSQFSSTTWARMVSALQMRNASFEFYLAGDRDPQFPAILFLGSGGSNPLIFSSLEREGIHAIGTDLRELKGEYVLGYHEESNRVAVDDPASAIYSMFLADANDLVETGPFAREVYVMMPAEDAVIQSGIDAVEQDGFIIFSLDEFVSNLEYWRAVLQERGFQVFVYPEESGSMERILHAVYPLGLDHKLWDHLIFAVRGNVEDLIPELEDPEESRRPVIETMERFFEEQSIPVKSYWGPEGSRDLPLVLDLGAGGGSESRNLSKAYEGQMHVVAVERFEDSHSYIDWGGMSERSIGSASALWTNAENIPPQVAQRVVVHNPGPAAPWDLIRIGAETVAPGGDIYIVSDGQTTNSYQISAALQALGYEDIVIEDRFFRSEVIGNPPEDILVTRAREVLDLSDRYNPSGKIAHPAASFEIYARRSENLPPVDWNSLTLDTPFMRLTGRLQSEGVRFYTNQFRRFDPRPLYTVWCCEKEPVMNLVTQALGGEQGRYHPLFIDPDINAVIPDQASMIIEDRSYYDEFPTQVFSNILVLGDRETSRGRERDIISGYLRLAPDGDLFIPLYDEDLDSWGYLLRGAGVSVVEYVETQDDMERLLFQEVFQTRDDNAEQAARDLLEELRPTAIIHARRTGLSSRQMDRLDNIAEEDEVTQRPEAEQRSGWNRFVDFLRPGREEGVTEQIEPEEIQELRIEPEEIMDTLFRNRIAFDNELEEAVIRSMLEQYLAEQVQQNRSRYADIVRNRVRFGETMDELVARARMGINNWQSFAEIRRVTRAVAIEQMERQASREMRREERSTIDRREFSRELTRIEQRPEFFNGILEIARSRGGI